jgi:hypothetical protein
MMIYGRMRFRAMRAAMRRISGTDHLMSDGLDKACSG